MSKETSRLENIANDSWYAKGVNAKTIRYSGQLFLEYMNDGSVLELGPAEGVMTEILYAHFSDYSLVEGSKIFSEKLQEKYPKIVIYNSLFEEFKTSRKYDNIVLGHVLEHVENPVSVLDKFKKYLATNGRLVAAVPNAYSLHRQAAVQMGLLKDEHALNETDHHHGHRRVYNPYTLRNHFIEAGYKVIRMGGYWIKPISNAQIDQSWTEEMIEAFMQLGEKYPDIAAEIYIIAEADRD